MENPLFLQSGASKTKHHVAWVSLEKTENDPRIFLKYLIASVQQIFPKVGEKLIYSINQPDSPPIERILTEWINSLTTLDKNISLVLDDFHHITNPNVLDTICNLIDHQPSQLSLLIASRADLPFSCARFRARGEIVDLGIDDLRFSTKEIESFLQMRLGDLASEINSEILKDKTEGWIAGLQMALLSMKNLQNPANYVVQFSAQDRHIEDFLIQEVLSNQSEKIKIFLLGTSILDKFSAHLCNHILSIDNSQEIIDYIELSGLFVIPLDTTRTWYRYHHLFASLLKKQLRNQKSLDENFLHKKAYEWLANENMFESAIPPTL